MRLFVVHAMLTQLRELIGQYFDKQLSLLLHVLLGMETILNAWTRRHEDTKGSYLCFTCL